MYGDPYLRKYKERIHLISISEAERLIIKDGWLVYSYVDDKVRLVRELEPRPAHRFLHSFVANRSVLHVATALLVMLFLSALYCSQFVLGLPKRSLKTSTGNLINSTREQFSFLSSSYCCSLVNGSEL
jgi:hypothetical protein